MEEPNQTAPFHDYRKKANTMPVRQNVPHMNDIINKYPGVQQ